MGLLLMPLVGDAQVATPGVSLAWDIAGADLVTVQGYTYRYYPDGATPDGATPGTVLTGVTCSGAASPFTCSVPFPAFTPGSHTLTLTAANVAGESIPSAPFSFVFVVVPGAPSNIRIQ
jgi:hypothetical protein